MGNTAVIIGATGAVGKEILKEIVLDTYKEIKKAWILKEKLLESKKFKTRWW